MIALSLLVIGLFTIVAHNVRRVLDRVESRVQIVAYLRDDANFEEVENARAELLKVPAVRAVEYVSREQAFENAKREIPEFQRIAGGLPEDNPLPASLGVALHPGQQGPEAAMAVAQRISQFPFVEEVEFGRDWLDKVYLLRRVAGAASLIMGGAFALAAALIIGAAIRIAVFARRDEISIMRLVGATDGFIRSPFLIEGVLTGLAGGVLALIFTYATYRVLSGSLLQLEWIPLQWAGLVLLLGAGVGGLASAVAVRRHLQEI
jgi:cell division transport system permease protein